MHVGGTIRYAAIRKVDVAPMTMYCFNIFNIYPKKIRRIDGRKIPSQSVIGLDRGPIPDSFRTDLDP